MKQEILNKILIFLIIVLVILLGYFSVNGYPNVNLIVAPMLLLIGFWIWMRQERMKRRADAAEEVIKKYDAFESRILTLWRGSSIKEYALNEDTKDFSNFKKILEEILSKHSSCLEAKKELHSSIKIFVRRNNLNYEYADISNFINEFNDLEYFLNFFEKVEVIASDGKNFQKIARQFDEIDNFLRSVNFGTTPEAVCIFDRPRKAIEKHTKNAFNLLVL